MTIQKLKEMINQAQKIVFFGGAGVSTESGLKDFRSEDGLYQNKYQNISPEVILSRNYFDNYPEMFFDYYRSTFLSQEVKPNYAHKYLAKLEQQGKDVTIITQNIDNLHQEAGSKNVIELHGSVYRNYSVISKKEYLGIEIMKKPGIPLNEDGEIIKPDVVLYGEQLDQDVLYHAMTSLRNADLLIVGGTSLTVYPAANLIGYYKGNNIVAINRDYINIPNFIQGNIGEIFKSVDQLNKN